MKVYGYTSVQDFDWKTLTEFLDHPDVYVIIAKLPKTRSLSQNRYYWGVVLSMLAEHTGFTKEEMHEVCKLKFNLKTKPMLNQVYEFGGPTKQLDTKEMTDYIESIRQWSMNDLNCRIPDPNEIPIENYIEGKLN